ncbi:MAG: SRPBCC domain-containing protein, partial [Solirubrobacteraceae bacterium]
AEPYSRLSYTWHTFTPEWAQTVGIGEERRARLAGERRSKVTFEIEPIDSEQLKLTVIHDDLEPDGLLVGMISGGWPRVISNLKTLLETGEPLPDARGPR